MDNNYENMSPEMLEALDLSGKAHKLIEENDIESALKLLDRAEQTEPMCIRIYMERSGALALEDHYEEALEQLDKALMIDRTSAETYYLKANVFLLQRNFEEALKNYKQSEDLGYSSPFMMNNMCRCYQEQHDYEQALACAVKAEELRPTWLEPWLNQVNLLMIMGRQEDAEEVARKINKDFPEFEASHTVFSDVLIMQGKLDEAEEVCRHAMEIFGQQFEYQMRIARIYNMQDKIEEEQKLLEEIAARDDLDQDQRRETDNMLGMCAMQRFDYEAATEAFEREIKNETPDQVCVQARFVLMSVYKLTGNYEALRRTAASSLETSEADEMLCSAYMMEAIALEGLGRAEDAKAIYESALRKYRLLSIANRDRTDTHLYRVYCHIGLKEYDKATDELEYVEKVMGESEITMTLRAQILRATGDEKGALEVEARMKGEAGE